MSGSSRVSHMSVAAVAVALLAFAPELVATARAEIARTPAQEALPVPEPRLENFRLARIPYGGARDLFRESQGLLDRLAQLLGARKASLVLAPDYEGVVKQLQAGEADAAWLGTIAYAQARLKNVGLVPLVCPQRKSGRSYTGLIITHRLGPVRKLSDLKGYRFGFVDRDSASGFLFPKLMLAEAGVSVPKDLVTLKPGAPDFLGNHANVVFNVLLRKVDAGAVYEGAVEEALGGDPVRSRDIRILARTEPIPGEPIVVLASTPQPVQERVRRAFMQLLADSSLSFEDVLSFAPVQARDYDWVTRLVEKASKADK